MPLSGAGTASSPFAIDSDDSDSELEVQHALFAVESASTSMAASPVSPTIDLPPEQINQEEITHAEAHVVSDSDEEERGRHAPPTANGQFWWWLPGISDLRPTIERSCILEETTFI